MARALIAGLIVYCLAPASIARADEIVFNTSFSTSGAFNCLWTIVCTGEGTNVVTFGSGANSATISFTGVETTLDVTTHLTTVTLGEFVLTATPGFTFPLNPANPKLPILGFGLTLNQTSPLAGSSVKSIAFGPGGGMDLTVQRAISNAFARRTGDPDYPEIVYTLRPFPFTIDGRTALTADVGAVPEPASLMLLGAGLAGGVLARRRRKR